MRINNGTPLETVSREHYEFHREETRLGPSDLFERTNYIARLIVNPSDEENYAADFLVVVQGIEVVTRKVFKPPFKEQYAKVAMAHAYKNRAGGEIDLRAVDQDGIIYNRDRLGLFSHENGYYTQGSGGKWEQALDGLVNAAPQEKAREMAGAAR